MLALLAAPRENGAGAGMVLLIQFAAIIAIFYFLLIRPQRKAQQRHREMVAALRRGDEIMTDGGIIGEVIHIKDDRVTIKTAENTRILVARPKIARVFTPEERQERR
jgi:preprotein translocase subunit YajC